MAIADFHRHPLPGCQVRNIVSLVLARVLHPGFEQTHLAISIQRIPVQALRGGEGAGGGSAAQGPFGELLADMLRHVHQPRHFGAGIKTHFNAVAAQIGREIRLIERAPFLDPTLQPGQVQAANMTAFRLDGIEDCGMSVELHVAGHAATRVFQSVKFGLLLAIWQIAHDRHGGAGGIVIE